MQRTDPNLALCLCGHESEPVFPNSFRPVSYQVHFLSIVTSRGLARACTSRETRLTAINLQSSCIVPRTAGTLGTLHPNPKRPSSDDMHIVLCHVLAAALQMPHAIYLEISDLS